MSPKSFRTVFSIVTPFLVTVMTFADHARGAADETAPAVTYTIRHTAGGTIDQFAVLSTGVHARADVIHSDEKVVRVLDAIIWPGGGERPIALNSQNETWYELQHNRVFTPRSRYLTPVHSARADRVRWQLEDHGVNAEGQRRYTGTLTYDVHPPGGGKVICEAALEITTTTTLDRSRWMGRILPLTTYPVVDEKLSAADTAIVGFPIRLILMAKRRYEGGPAMEDRASVEVFDIREKTATATAFKRPAHYRMQTPVYGFPGQ